MTLRIHLHVYPTHERCRTAAREFAEATVGVGALRGTTDTVVVGNDKVMFASVSDERDLYRLQDLKLDTLTNHGIDDKLYARLQPRVRPWSRA